MITMSSLNSSKTTSDLQELSKHHKYYTYDIGSFMQNDERLKSKEENMDKKMWLKGAAGLSFFMAICQTIISLSPAAAAYFQAPPPLLENRVQLFLIGEGAALILVFFGFYALSGAGSIPHLPLLRLGLVGISSL